MVGSGMKKLSHAVPTVSHLSGQTKTKNPQLKAESQTSQLADNCCGWLENSNLSTTLCIKKTSPTFLTVTWKPIIRFW